MPKPGEDSTVELRFTIECAFRLVRGATATHEIVHTMHAERLDPTRSMAFISKGGVADGTGQEPDDQNGGAPLP